MVSNQRVLFYFYRDIYSIKLFYYLTGQIKTQFFDKSIIQTAFKYILYIPTRGVLTSRDPKLMHCATSPRGLVSHMSIGAMENKRDFPVFHFVWFNTFLFVLYSSYTPMFVILIFI